jgi:hypothetical protein
MHRVSIFFFFTVSLLFLSAPESSDFWLIRHHIIVLLGFLIGSWLHELNASRLSKDTPSYLRELILVFILDAIIRV